MDKFTFSPLVGLTDGMRVGTSGWYYRDWVGRFYPRELDSSGFLNYYSRFFDTVELNGVFYRLPQPTAVKQWYERSPKNFIFAYKGSRFLTHIKKLKDPQEPLRLMFKRADLLKEKLGPVLFQLPPSWPVQIPRLKIFLEVLPRGYDCTMEFRHASWFTDEVYDLLEKHGVGLCQYDMKGEASPDRLTSRLVYVRMHGSEQKYAGNYTAAALDGWIRKIKRWEKDRRQIFIYFNNDIRGHAIKNAVELKKKLHL